MSQEQTIRESLGGSSRDEERGSRGQRRTHSSSGFLVDSFLPRSKSFRSSNQHSRRSESDHQGKRGTSETEPTPKKRSRFPWSRQRDSRQYSDTFSHETLEDKQANGSPRPPGDITGSKSHAQGAASHTERLGESREDQTAGKGLDKDSLQIVNLALNLSESRKRGHVGYNASNRVSSGVTWVSSGDGRTSAADSIPSRGSYPGHNACQSLGDDSLKSSRPAGVSMFTNDVLNSLPKSATSETVPEGLSAGTLARAANTCQYFELRYEYLRLLPSLPPLRPHATLPTVDSSRDPGDRYPQHRVYNPLQAIRNRKVRFRERCPIDTEADGWNNVDKVHSWVDSVEASYSRQARSPLECLKLPPFGREHPDGLPSQDTDIIDTSAVSPPSSLRRISRTGSLKARRPRSDWMIDPDELLADAAWVEEAENKSRLVDKEGNTLYPNASSLIVNDHQEQTQGKSSASIGRTSSQASQSDTRQSLSVDINEHGRGRHPRKLKAPLRMGRSSSASGQDLGSKKRKLRILPRSSSTSSADEGPYRDPWGRSPRRSRSPPKRKGPIWIEKRGSLSSVPSADDRYDPLSLAKMEGRGSNTAMDITFFPSIASNLSAPSSRSSSPAKRSFPRAIGPQRSQSRSSLHRKAADADDSSVDFEVVRKYSVPLTEPASQPESEPLPLSAKSATYHPESQARMTPHERKDSVQHESKLRGIFKGPGKIAGKVGNEVSRMGDFIMKKEGVTHSRKSSLALSDDSDSDDEEAKSDKRAIPRALLRRLPTFYEDPSRSSPRNSEKSLAKNSTRTPPTFIESRQHRDENELGASPPSGSHARFPGLQSDAGHHSSFHKSKFTDAFTSRGPRALRFGPEIHTVRDEIKKGRIKDPSVPFSMTRPPITGLAQAQPIPGPSPQGLRPAFSGQSRSWSISDRSVSISIESGVPGKQETERTRALLLSSGIKAREITRRAEAVRSPPAEFLQQSFGTDASVPSVPRLYEHEVASRSLLRRIEASHSSFQNSLEHIPKAAFSPLKSQLSTLEDLVNNSLNSRVYAAAEEAENLSMHLNTTSTLAVKQLSETLDYGLRKRHRRLRWLRRTGFLMLEWALIGLLWWVWMIVVVFKLFRKLLYGMVSGARWILWL
ncbi:hypothetical protein BJX99DRAFT_175489 [Aspergillus californicus]